HDGVVYHVQTEDKGLDSPLILSLVYSGGAILASKRSHYDDLIASGFSEEALAERLKRQHRLICAAIHAGRIEELKRMGQTGPLSLGQTPIEAPETVPPAPESQSPADSAPSLGVAPPAGAQPSAEPGATSADEPKVEPVVSSTPPADVYTVHDHRRQSPLGERPKVGEGLRVKLLDERPFHSGDTVNLRISVSYYGGSEETPVNAATVSVKVLGTTFRPQIYSVKTQRDGIANISAQIPKFTSGRAAILIRVTAGSDETEMRRVIQAS
ncbi:MAG TPA: hypothetical protein VFH31_09695, partial [Pyrinomonadaceae bacterium]|nr:hypothetical protein [Pyrinomonadaceae bacterium]